MASKTVETFAVTPMDGYYVASFTAMASPCEILIRSVSEAEAEQMASLAYSETMRIEHKFSRYRDDNVIYEINNSNGKRIEVDEETARLLHHAGQCHEISEGMFDVTSGVLRRAWTFKGGEVNPDQKQIDALLKLVGWDRVEFDLRAITLKPGMEIDLGGIGKEYAVDRVAELLLAERAVPIMVNFGGDIRAVAPEGETPSWLVGIEDPAAEQTALGEIELSRGAVATSGDARRYCLYKGRRLGHILDPQTGWPVENAPRSVTVIADFCIEAGFLSTMAMLHGADAEEFLDVQEVKYHVNR